MLSFVTTGGCATKRPALQQPSYRCEKPPLRGETWADVAILSVEQASAIDVCNIRNGVDVYERKLKATRAGTPTPTPAECGDVGVQIPHDAVADGIIRSETMVDVGGAGSYCDSMTDVGCAKRIAPGLWDIYYENEGWILVHERCHARYNSARHTLEYLATRQQVK